MLEIEQKYRDVDFASLTRQLLALGAVSLGQRIEVDHYHNAPDRDFAKTGEAFRLRRVGPHNFFTYKGPRESSAIRVRREVEIALPEGDTAAAEYLELLQLLGYRAVAVVHKQRTLHSITRGDFLIHICLDEVSQLGQFAEVEVVTEAQHKEQALATLEDFAKELHLRQVEPKSYLSLLLSRNAQSPSSTQPKIAQTIPDLRSSIREARRLGKTIGFVPTMGALHEGHKSLIQAARARNEFVVVSIFVNPAQFGPNEDLNRYPRPFSDDLALCGAAGVDLIWHPTPEVIYPAGYRTYVEVHGIQDAFEGASRPGHFRGVATVVLKLFNQVQADRAYFGQKDAQQVRVIGQMIRDLDVPIELIVCPTVREPDGLAMSSRNRYLDAGQRSRAIVLSQALNDAAALFAKGQRDPIILRQAMQTRIASVPEAKLDYAAIIDEDSFLEVAENQVLDKAGLLALAVKFGETRLIDNLPLREECERHG